MSNAIDLTSENFDEKVSDGVALVDFWAPWCGPCKMMAPVLDKVHAQTAGKAVIAKVDIDAEQELGRRFMVRSLPTLILMKDGEVVKQWTGVQQASVLVDAIAKL